MTSPNLVRRPLLELPLARITHTPRAWGPIAAWCVLAIGAALVFARARTGAGDALVDTFAAFALPLIAFTAVGAALGGDGLARSTRALAAFGASPPRVALHSLAVAVAVTALTTAVLGALVAILAHGANDPPVARDAFNAAWIAALGGASYAALFTFGASFGKRGIGRPIVLAVDWVLGSSDGYAGLLTPRAHLRSLLGGSAVLEMSGRLSAVALVVLALAFGALAIRRARLD